MPNPIPLTLTSTCSLLSTSPFPITIAYLSFHHFLLVNAHRKMIKRGWLQMSSCLRLCCSWSVFIESCLGSVTRTSVVGLAPIYFLPCPRLLPIPRGLCVHTHAIPILVDCTLSLSLLVIFSLIAFSFTCTISAHWILSSFPLCPFYSPGTHPIMYILNPYLTIGSWCHHPFTLTLLLVSDSVPCLPAYLCTTTYSLVCAQVPYVYKPCVPQLYSLTWIYLVLHGYLVHNL
jgi:hypothetical protein